MPFTVLVVDASPSAVRAAELALLSPEFDVRAFADGLDLVVYADARGEGALHVAHVRPPYESLRFGDADVLYCDARPARERIRFLRGPQADLLRHVEEAGDRFLLPLPGGRRQEIRPDPAG